MVLIGAGVFSFELSLLDKQEVKQIERNSKKKWVLFMKEIKPKFIEDFLDYPFIFNFIPGFRSSFLIPFNFFRSDIETPGYFFEILYRESPFFT